MSTTPRPNPAGDGRIGQFAPDPHELRQLVDGLTYKPGWTFTLHDWLDRGQGSVGTTLVITALVLDSYHPASHIRVNHYMPVPPAAFDTRSWRRWLLEQILLVERHEAAEFFAVHEDRPYAPSHAAGNDPYLVRELGTIADQRTPAT